MKLATQVDLSKKILQESFIGVSREVIFHGINLLNPISALDAIAKEKHIEVKNWVSCRFTSNQEEGRD